MPSLKLTKEEALNILYESKEVRIRDMIIDHSRWTVTHELIFLKKGKMWRITYDVGATEYQDETAWQYDNEIIAKEVRPIITTDYEVIADAQPS